MAKHPRWRRYYSARGAMVMLWLVAGWLVPSVAIAQANGHLQVHVIKVGQGDATLIISPLGQTLLLDSGPLSSQSCASSTGIITYLASIGLTRLDYHVASHYDADHIGCTDHILGTWPIQQAVYDRGTVNPPSTQTYNSRYVTAVAGKRHTVSVGQQIILDGGSSAPVTLNVIAVNGNGMSGSLSENDRSIVLVLHFGSFDAEFGGDLSGDPSSSVHNLESLIASSVGQVELYKVHHHGSATSSNSTFLAALHPKVATLSMGSPNAYDHPTQAVLNRIRSTGAITYWTTAGDGAAAVSPYDVVVNDSFVVDVPVGGTTFGVQRNGTTDTYASWPSGSSCTFGLSPTSANFTANGGTGTVTVTAGSGCAWTAVSNATWVTIASGATGSGTGTVSYSVAATTGPARSGTLTAAGQTFTVTQAAALLVSAPPFGAFDTPTNGATALVGAIPVTGWTLDDVGVIRAMIWRNCVETIDRPAGACAAAVPGGPADFVYIGDGAFLSGARPDVAAAFSTYPQADRAGWGYLMLTNALPHLTAPVAAQGGQGTFTLSAYALDGESHYTLLGQKTITLDNDHATVPFGAIDTPSQGGTVTSAIYANFGWAMTQSPKCIDTTTTASYRMYIDGVSLPLTPGMNWFPGLDRSDIAAAFPGLCNTNNALAAYYIDVNALGLANGLHTTGWDVIDDQGNVAGIGSRFFNVLIGSVTARDAFVGPDAFVGLDAFVVSGFLTAVASAEAVSRTLSDRPVALGVASDLDALSAALRLVRVRVGPDDVPLEAVTADSSGRYAVQFPAGTRIAFDLGDPVDAGYQIVGDELRVLPGGSTLDAANGQFTWQPPVPFLGTFHLVFTSSGQRLNVLVTITDATAASAVAMHVDTPARSATISSSFVVAGWALDPLATTGSGIDTLHVWAYRRDAIAPPQFLGAAAVGGVRPDVAALFGEQFEAPGFTLTVPSLASGVYDLLVYPWSHRTGRFEEAAVVRVLVR